MRISIRPIFTFLFFSIVSGTAFSGGFQVALQGEKQTGMAHCGAGLALDGATLFFNPGGLAFVERNSIHAGFSAIMARFTYQESAPGQYSASNQFRVSPPFNIYGHYSVGKNKRFSIGLGVYTPFGSRVAYDPDWKGQFMLRELALKAIFVQPTFSMKVTDWLGVGFGPVIASGSVELKKAIPAQFPDGTYGQASLAGGGSGYGFNAGVFVKSPDKKLSAGLSYRSSLLFNAPNGSATFSVPDNLAEYFPNTTFSAKIKLPSTTTLGLGYKLSEKITLALDINFVGWAVYDTLAFDFAIETDKLKDQHSPREYKNVFVFRLGGQYEIKPNFTLRAGAYFDMTPVQNGYITPETPDANKMCFTGGLSYILKDRVGIDLSFLYVEGFKREAVNYENNFGGIFKARAFIPGIGFNVLLDGKKATQMN